MESTSKLDEKGRGPKDWAYDRGKHSVKAKWIPGVPPTSGFFMVKGPDRKPTVIEIDLYPHDKCFYYWSLGNTGRQLFKSTIPHAMNFEEVYTHYYPIIFPEY